MKPVAYRVCEWVLVKFPVDESDKIQKLARPWHSPYRITKVNGPNVSVIKVNQKDGIKVHQSMVKDCPIDFPTSFYWYNGKSKAPERPPKWIGKLLAGSRQTRSELFNTADENASDAVQTSCDRCSYKTDIKHGDLPMVNENVDRGLGDILKLQEKRVLKYPYSQQ